jgi:hypothetical protein
MQFRSKILTFIFTIVLLVSAYIRFSQSINYDFPFTFDQARDMLDIRVIGNFIDFKVSGPTTSITGLNLGPYYYIFSLPAYWTGGGDPQFLVYWNILWFLLSAIIIYLFFYKRNQILGFFISSIYLMSPQLFTVTRYFWNANSVVYFILFYFLALWNFIEKKDSRSALIWGITAGLVIQFEAAFGSMCLAFAFLTILTTKNWKTIRNFMFGSLPWFLPQVAYEVMHNFQMTKRFLGILNGENPILGVQLPLSEVFVSHLNSFSKMFEGQFMLPYGYGLALLALAIVVAIFSTQYRKQTIYFLGFILFAFLYYLAIYHHELKPWYLEGLRVWFIFIIGIGIASITKYKKVAFILVAVFLIRSFYLTYFDQQVYVIDNGNSNDPKNAANIITTIDWVYKHADNQGFVAYNYVPEVYDFSPQYMYSWYGMTKYGYMPSRVSYSLASVPEYIRSETFFQEHKKDSNGDIALIYETIGDYKTWLTQFDDYCIVDKEDHKWHVITEWREKCN